MNVVHACRSDTAFSTQALAAASRGTTLRPQAAVVCLRFHESRRPREPVVVDAVIIIVINIIIIFILIAFIIIIIVV